MRYLTLHTTIDSEETAHKIGRQAVAERMAACVQITPIESIYRWQGKIETSREFRLELKTRSDKSELLLNLVKKLHSYSVPELIETEIQSLSPDYLSWFNTQLAEPPKS